MTKRAEKSTKIVYKCVHQPLGKSAIFYENVPNMPSGSSRMKCIAYAPAEPRIVVLCARMPHGTKGSTHGCAGIAA